ncbi:MAG: DUF58 domain-containing protein [Desulfovermiculus sp.]|nr:DUF58 domain-containing protein [Desulfovermiculus sp.]
MLMRLPRFDGLRLLLKGPVQTAHPVTLSHKRIFILPTGLGLVFGLMVLAMLGISINYANNLGYAVSFVCMSTGLVSLLHTQRNLNGLRIAPGKCEPVFAGQRAVFHLVIHEDQGRTRPGIKITGPEGSQNIDLPFKQPIQVPVSQKTETRGLTSLQGVRISTIFPLGLFRAWSRVRPEMQCLVYPRPADSRLTAWAVYGKVLGPSLDEQSLQAGADEFSGLDEYQPGESARRIHWKAYARGQGLVVREFADSPVEGIIFDFHALPAALETEERLSILCRLILDARNSGRTFGLRLPETNIPPGSGVEHEKQCLKALALYDF